jgi:hypothetical protein
MIIRIGLFLVIFNIMQTPLLVVVALLTAIPRLRSEAAYRLTETRFYIGQSTMYYSRENIWMVQGVTCRWACRADPSNMSESIRA